MDLGRRLSPWFTFMGGMAWHGDHTRMGFVACEISEILYYITLQPIFVISNARVCNLNRTACSQ